MKIKTAIITLIALSGFLLIGTGCSKSVTRIDGTQAKDLSGHWNDVDSRKVSDDAITEVLNQAWLPKFATTHGKNPTVIVGMVRNLSTEHIAVGTFIKDIERAFINSGKVTVVASALERGEARDERREQQENADPETIKKFGKERGADYILSGEINTIEDREGKESVITFQVDLQLTDLQTNEKVWSGGSKITKDIKRAAIGG